MAVGDFVVWENQTWVERLYGEQIQKGDLVYFNDRENRGKDDHVLGYPINLRYQKAHYKIFRPLKAQISFKSDRLIFSKEKR